MATLHNRFNLRKCQKQHLGPILLGRFLETGFLYLTLTERDHKHLGRTLGARSATETLIEIFVTAAQACGLGKECNDWISEHDASSLRIRDPRRMPY